MNDHIPKLHDSVAPLPRNEDAITTAQVPVTGQGDSDNAKALSSKIKAAKEKIRGVFSTIECEKIEHGFNTVLVYALIELASEEGKDDGWFQEAFNETMWNRHNSRR